MKKKFTIAIAVMILFTAKNIYAQTNTFPSTGSAGIGTTTPNASAKLEIKSTLKGLLIPRMTKAQRNAISSPATGLLIYQLDESIGFFYYTGTSWQPVAGIPTWKTNGTSIYYNGGRVGIGTTTPVTRLQVVDSSVLFSAAGDIPSSPHNTPVSGAGRRMMWYPDKAAFRVGYVDNNQWDAANIGIYSFATGYDVTANNLGAVAMGVFSSATAEASMAIGEFTSANNKFSVAMGLYSIASGAASFALGSDATASGDAAIATGANTLASGNISTAMGRGSTASGIISTAIGSGAIASGDLSVALGTSVTTNGQSGAFIFGDDATGRPGGSYYNDVPNQMQMVFAGGYRLYTGTSAAGVRMNGGDNSWSSVSDSTKKEKKLLVDGEDVLNKISKFKLTTWNYKGQDPKVFRHYGPMAQDFHNAFGKDALGTIGNDTLINQQDFLGVSFIAIQALEKRTETIKTQQQEIDSLKSANNSLQQQLNDVDTKINQIENAMSQCCSSFSSSMQINSLLPNAITDAARLEQNVPNPFNRSSFISYYIPPGIYTAQLVITDVTGHVLKTYALSQTGYGKQIIASSELASGTYQYSLLIDGKLIDTKKMITAR